MTGENTEIMKLIHSQVQGIVGTLGDIREDIGSVKSGLQSFGKSLDEHPAKCPAIRALNGGKMKSSDPLNAKLSGLSTWSIRLAPLILAAALGLIGLGFYFASGNSDDAASTVRALRSLADTTMKMSSELKKIQTELDAGETGR